MAKPTLWITRKLSDATEQRAARDYDVILNPEDRVYSGDEIVAMSGRIDAILPCHSEIFSKDVAARLSDRVKIIANHSVGVDHCDLAALKARGIVAITGIDTRALTALIRENGMQNAVIAHAPDGVFDLDALKREAAAWGGMVGLDLAKDVTCGQSYTWDETSWQWGKGFGRQDAPRFHVVAMDFGLKRNILRELAAAGCKITVVPATTSAEAVLARKPDGVFVSNGPGDPAATGVYAVPEIKKIVESGVPTFGICLGHQMLGIALGGITEKMHQGHHGANHPVKDYATAKVEITSMNHGFAVARESLPGTVEETHVSLFDGSNAGLKLKDKPVFSVQYHPEASPGPQDSHYLFTRFVELMEARKDS